MLCPSNRSPHCNRPDNAVNFPISVIAFTLLITLFTQTAIAAPQQATGPITLNVSAKVIHEDNLFRLNDSEDVTTAVAPGATRSDDIQIYSAGLLARAHQSRQSFLLEVMIDDHHFENNTQLDHQSGHARLNWDWQLVDDISGKAEVAQYRWLGDFADSQFYGKDVLTQNLGIFEIGYRLKSRLRLLGATSFDKVEHDDPTRQYENTESLKWRSSLEYTSLAGNQVALDYSSRTVEYPDADSDVEDSSDFRDNVLTLRSHYSPSDITNIDIQIGYLGRQYDEPTYTDFSGTVGEVKLDWQRIQNLELNFSAWRELKAHREQGTEYFVADGYSIDATYTPWKTLDINLQLLNERMNYQIGRQDEAAINRRLDNRYVEALEFIYSPRSYLEVSLHLEQEKRRSNLPDQEFDAAQYWLGFTLRW